PAGRAEDAASAQRGSPLRPLRPALAAARPLPIPGREGGDRGPVRAGARGGAARRRRRRAPRLSTSRRARAPVLRDRRPLARRPPAPAPPAERLRAAQRAGVRARGVAPEGPLALDRPPR